MASPSVSIFLQLATRLKLQSKIIWNNVLSSSRSRDFCEQLDSLIDAILENTNLHIDCYTKYMKHCQHNTFLHYKLYHSTTVFDSLNKAGQVNINKSYHNHIEIEIGTK
jgi:hypothetical protein